MYEQCVKIDLVYGHIFSIEYVLELILAYFKNKTEERTILYS